MKKEKWIEEILQSAKDIKPVSSNPYLTTRIEAKLQAIEPINKLPLRWVYVAAAAMLLLLAMNITIWRSTARSSQTSGVQQLIQEYGWDNNDLYSMNLSNRKHE
jgi:hypothetical protein